MPNCEYFEELCSASLDGELTRAQKRELDAHLAECPACTAYLEDLKLLRTAWGDLKEPLPEELHEKIMGGILEEANKKVAPMQKRKRRPPVFTMIAAAAACVLLAVSGVFSNLNADQTGTVAGTGGAAMENTTEPPAASTPQTADAQPDIQQSTDEIAPSVLVPAQDVVPDTQPQSEPQTGGSASASSGQSDVQSQSDAATPRQAQADARVMTVNRAEVQSISLPDNLQTHRFEMCYVAVGSGEAPALQDATLLEKIDNVYYFELAGGMSSVEADIKALQQNGFETASRQDIGVTIDENAESVLLIVVIEG